VTFAGFSPAATRFLADLGERNERAWFHANRAVYERELLEPARDLVEALGEELEQRGIQVSADPRVGRSIMRIARDTRFAKDKRPYKDHLDLWLWQGSGPSRQCAGFWFSLTPERLYLGAGMHRFDRSLLERYREAVVDVGAGARLAAAVGEVAAAGCELGGRSYKRVPRGYDAAHERAGLLLHDGLYAWIGVEHPPELRTARFPAFCADRYARMRPVQDWVVGLVGP
jgi:uncharacterized protein (TIGR02453 family)